MTATETRMTPSWPAFCCKINGCRNRFSHPTAEGITYQLTQASGQPLTYAEANGDKPPLEFGTEADLLTSRRGAAGEMQITRSAAGARRAASLVQFGDSQAEGTATKKAQEKALSGRKF
jgi:hypothetical protein